MLSVETLDRRMSGYENFKYRVKFTDYPFSDDGSSARQANRDFLAASRYMCERYGYGPELRTVWCMIESGEGVPAWATRHAYQALNSAAPDTIYLRDDTARDAFEAFLTFIRLKAK